MSQELAAFLAARWGADRGVAQGALTREQPGARPAGRFDLLFRRNGTRSMPLSGRFSRGVRTAQQNKTTKKILVLVLAVCLVVPAFAAAQEKAEKEESLFQIYSKDQTPENFISAYNAYNIQMKDSVNHTAVAMLAWLNY
jgi:hypothetical protein